MAHQKKTPAGLRGGGLEEQKLASRNNKALLFLNKYPTVMRTPLMVMTGTELATTVAVPAVIIQMFQVLRPTVFPPFHSDLFEVR